MVVMMLLLTLYVCFEPLSCSFACCSSSGITAVRVALKRITMVMAVAVVAAAGAVVTMNLTVAVVLMPMLLLLLFVIMPLLLLLSPLTVSHTLTWICQAGQIGSCSVCYLPLLPVGRRTTSMM